MLELNRIDIKDLTFTGGVVNVIEKSGRIVDEVNHGRKVFHDEKNYYKIFDHDYCRRQNFIDALNVGFFDEIAPALTGLIMDGDEIIGYIMERGKPISQQELASKKEFNQKLIDLVTETGMFYYDFVKQNVIKTYNKLPSIIDLESVYPIHELYQIDRHNAVVKPDSYFNKLETIWKENLRPISFIQPSRNNLKYLKWSYESIRKNLSPIHEICWADDFSDDGTWEWMQEIAKKDPQVKIYRNEGPNRLGHTILYDTLVDMATNDIVMIYHADMYACPGLDEKINKHIRPGVVVSATRIEPPLHPEGPEKIIEDYGIEPEEFKEQELLDYVYKRQNNRYSVDVFDNNPTKGIFAPWAIYKKDFQDINGHDPLYAPQSKEDSDIFNRFVLAGYDLVQTWEGYVYHMTCRGSRFKDGALRNPAGQVFMKGRESSEWLEQNLRSTRNFIRKWGHMVKHDKMMYPIIPPKYDVGFVVKNCENKMLAELEPWCSSIYVDCNINDYIYVEQKKTAFNLSDRIKPYDNEKNNNIIVEFDATRLNAENFQILVNLSEILRDSAEVGEMELDIFKFNIQSLETYEKDLIIRK